MSDTTPTKKRYCGHEDHSSIDHTHAGRINDLLISFEQCRSLAEGKKIYLADHLLEVDYDTKTLIVITDGPTSSTNRNHCDGCSGITRDTFLPYMQRTILKVRMSTGKFLSDSARVLLCALEELGYETTSLDPHAYIPDSFDNCVLSVLRTEHVNMMKQGAKCYYNGGPQSTTDFIFGVKNNPQKHCGNPGSQRIFFLPLIFSLM